ncbi:MAG TPA: OsmC family protein [Chitinophagaceae bacterium]|nr:OsmC family protein [Chitinophagaceae bacterium]
MKHTATVSWAKTDSEVFTDGRYNRVHRWKFDGGAEFNASASPHVVPIPFSDPSLVDPEEAFIASIASCHMLFFLSFCARQKYIIKHYEDQAEGILDTGDDGRKQILSVKLHPVIQFEGENLPTEATIRQLHELAHENCFIANSVKTKIEVVIATDTRI